MTAFISSPATNKKPAGTSILRRACLETGPPLPGLVTTTTAKIEMKPGQADVSTAAAPVTRAMSAVAGAMTATMTGTGAAAMADRAIAIHSMTVTVIAGDGAFAIHGRAAGTAVVRETATGTVSIKSLHSGRSENGKAGGDSQESDELFHCELGLIRCRQMSGLSQQTKRFQDYSDASFVS